MNNLFAIFDPSANFHINLNWASVVLVSLFLPSELWKLNSPYSLTLKKSIIFLHKEKALALGVMWSPGATHLLISFFLFIVLNNFLGLMPYVFTASSHLSFTMSLALPLCGGLLSMSLMSATEYWSSHLVPLGTPPVLIFFMVFIELVSSMIRPITLSVRLAANMVAGHLLLALLSGPIPQVPMMLAVVIFLFLIVLSTLELAVSLIQGYVFSTLGSLYLAEVPSSKVS